MNEVRPNLQDETSHLNACEARFGPLIRYVHVICTT